MNTSLAPQNEPVDWSPKFQNRILTIENLQKEGKNKSAFDESASLIDDALDSLNVPALVRGLKYLIENANQVEDEVLREKLISLGQILPDNLVMAAFYNSYMGELLGVYYERNRYRTGEGRPGEPVLPWTELHRWTSLHFESAIDSFYTMSVRQPDALQESSVQAKSILEGDTADLIPELRPRIVDLLTERYVYFLQNPRFHRSAVDFVAGKEEAGELTAMDLDDFLKRKEWSDHRFYRIIAALDTWEKSLLQSENREAWLDVVLNRLEFVRPSIPAEWEYWYEEALNRLVRNSTGLKNSAAISIRMAEYRMGKQEFSSALALLEENTEKSGVNSYSHYQKKMESLIRQIRRVTLSAETEEVYPADAFPLILLRHKNLDRAFLKLHAIPEEVFIEKYFSGRMLPDSIKPVYGGREVWQDSVIFPVSDDYKEHRSEIMIRRKLSFGTYALEYTGSQDSTDISGYVLFQVSDLGLLMTGDQKDSELWVVNRNDGSILKDAEVRMRTRGSSGNSGRDGHILEKKENRFIFPPARTSNIYFIAEFGRDRYISPLSYLQSPYHNELEAFRRTVLFTDRAIYQPGDLIRFKALTVLTKKLTTDLLKNQKITVALRDANGQEVWSEELVTDEWGSVTGSVVVPASGLKGRWSLQANPSGTASVQIEEYVRPNFEVEVEDEDISRSEGRIHLRGSAATYSGFPVQEGKGKAEVGLQEVRWFFGGPQETVPLYQTEFVTDQEGGFEIDFEEVSMREQPQWRKGTYLYHIKVTVEAPSGEIRELEKKIPLDPDRMTVRTEARSFYGGDDFPPLIFSVKNALNTDGSLTVRQTLEELEAPDRYKIDRYWDLPDRPLISRRELQADQPRYFYDHRADLNEWPVKKVLADGEQVLTDGDALPLDSLIGKPGYYRLLIRDSEGDTLTSVSFGRAAKSDDFSISHAPAEILPDRETARPGDTVRLDLWQADELKNGLIRIARADGTREELELKDRDQIGIPVTEKDRGRIHVNITGFLSGRYFMKNIRIDVPWTDKELKIETDTILESLEVNSENELNISIYDEDGEGVSSEVAVVIYDASLDAYVPHAWKGGETFFRIFNNPLYIRNLTGHTGSARDVRREDHKSDIIIPPLILPELTGILPAYGWLYSGPGRTLLQTRRQYMAPAADALMKESANTAVEESVTMDAAGDAGAEAAEAIRYREDFEETILFQGKLKSDENGKLTVPFHTNDKAGRWKVLIFSHTPSLQYGEKELTFETTQSLYLEGFLPEILRQGDQVNLRFTLYNTTDSEESGKVEWEVVSLFGGGGDPGSAHSEVFEIKGKSSQVFEFSLPVEADQNGPLIIRSRVKDENGKILDAVEKVIPVLPAVQTVRKGQVVILKEGEELPQELWKDQENFSADEIEIRIVQNMFSELLKSIPYLHTSNPVTTDQYFRNGLYAAMGKYITDQVPGFEKIYAEWKRKGELTSRLSQNEDKKYTDLNNTPWAARSRSGTEQMARLSLYFDKSHIAALVEGSLDKWKSSQNPDGGFPWIEGGTSDFYMTGIFLQEMAKADWSGIPLLKDQDDVRKRALEYVDAEFTRRYREMKQKEIPFHYRSFLNFFYTRAYYPLKKSAEWEEGWKALRDSVQLHWADLGTADRAAAGIAAFHLGDTAWSRMVVNSFLDNAIRDSEIGIYWKNNISPRQADYLKTLSLISELLLVNHETSLDEGILHWVLNHKMTNDWHRNPNVFSLMLSLLQMEDDFAKPSVIEVDEGGSVKTLTGIGDADSFRWRKGDGNFNVKNVEGHPVWVGLISSRKVRFGELTEPEGDILKIHKKEVLPVRKEMMTRGDKLLIRLEIESDRDLDYVFVEDPLVAGSDPGISLSGWSWKQGLSYYQSFGHESVRFFIEHMPRGHYILEYEVGLVRSGSFVNPATVIQSYFVPEINGYDPWKSEVRIEK